MITPGIAENLHLVGDRWTLLILRDLFVGRHRFDQLQAYTGAGRATLTRRLNSLVAADLVVKVPYGKSRSEYQLAEKGRALYPAALCAWAWEHQFAEVGEELPQMLVHESCGAELAPKVCCERCGQTLERNDVSLGPDTSLQQQLLHLSDANKNTNANRRRRRATPGDDESMTHITEIVGDRWSILILVAMFFGVAKYDDMLQLLGIATNILGERLNQLLAGKVIEKVPYQKNPVRYRYLLTKRGEALYGFVMTIWQWARDYDREHAGAADPVDILTHRCGKSLLVTVQCGACGDALQYV